MRLLFILFLVGFLRWWLGAEATIQGAARAELEASIPCYARYAPEVWNLVLAHAPLRTRQNVDRLARLLMHLTAQLRAQVPPCAAVARILPRTERDSVQWECAALQPLTEPQALLRCLGGAHFVGTMALLSTPDEERAEAWNLHAQAAATNAPEEGLAFGAVRAFNSTYLQATVSATHDAMVTLSSSGTTMFPIKQRRMHPQEAYILPDLESWLKRHIRP